MALISARRDADRTIEGIFKDNIYIPGNKLSILIVSELARRFSKMMPVKLKMDLSKVILSPMPGMVKSVSCNAGDTMAEGQEVCIVEAMKMQNSLIAAATGKVKAVHVKAGDTVGEDDVLIEFE